MSDTYLLKPNDGGPVKELREVEPEPTTDELALIASFDQASASIAGLMTTVVDDIYAFDLARGARNFDVANTALEHAIAVVYQVRQLRGQLIRTAAMLADRERDTPALAGQ